MQSASNAGERSDELSQLWIRINKFMDDYMDIFDQCQPGKDLSHAIGAGAQFSFPFAQMKIATAECNFSDSLTATGFYRSLQKSARGRQGV
jgi:hypothetical protein